MEPTEFDASLTTEAGLFDRTHTARAGLWTWLPGAACAARVQRAG